MQDAVQEPVGDGNVIDLKPEPEPVYGNSLPMNTPVQPSDADPKALLAVNLTPEEAAILDDVLAQIMGLVNNLGDLRLQYVQTEQEILGRLQTATGQKKSTLEHLAKLKGIDKRPGEWAYDAENKAFKITKLPGR